MLGWDESYNWSYSEYKNVVDEAVRAGKNYISLDTAHCSAANEGQLVKWANADGYKAEIKEMLECVKIYFKEADYE
jgi:hypothetical protein